MYMDPATRMPQKQANGWMTVCALGLLVLGLLGCLYVLIGFPAEAQVTGSTIDPPGSNAGSTTGPTAGSGTGAARQALPSAQDNATSPQTVPPVRYRRIPVYSPSALGQQVPAAQTGAPSSQPVQPIRRRQYQTYGPPVVIQEVPAAPSPAATMRSELLDTEIETELNHLRDQVTQSQEVLHQAAESQHRTRIASALFLLIFAVIAAIIVVQVYIQARSRDNETSRSSKEVAELRSQLEAVRGAGGESRSALPGLLQEIGEQPLGYQEEGDPFAPRTMAVIDDIDHLAYVGQGRVAFRDLASPAEAAVYLNGLLLSAVARLSRSDPWTAFSRLDQFFSQLSHFPGAIESLRIAQGYSYRALAAYQVLETQDREPSWRRKADRAQLESISKQAFADVAHAAAIDPEWKHANFVEALLCSRFYLTLESADHSSRGELMVRGLRRSVTLYKGLIDERAYRGPARRNLIRSLKQIAELTGEKSDFSEFGYALNAFPADDELADEALASRQPNSQDRYLWQWMMGDELLFAKVNRLNLAEYRAFWIRMLDNKVRLRNWRADLAELIQSNPAMKDWAIQLMQPEAPPIALSHASHRRLERYDVSSRFDTPASGA